MQEAKHAPQEAVSEALPYKQRWAGPNYAPKLVKPLRRIENDRPSTGILRDVPRPSDMDKLLRRAAGEQPGKPGTTLRAPGQSQHADAGGAFPQSSRPRELRTDVKPSEGLSMVRSKSFWDKDASGGTVAGGKAIERAVRDGVKQAVPATKPLLRQQGLAMDAVPLLDHGELLAGSRDTLGGFAQAVGAANGGGGLLRGILMRMLKEGQLKAGIAAPGVGRAIERTGRITPDLVRGLLGSLMSGHTQEQD
jgi:hypothetical protein